MPYILARILMLSAAAAKAVVRHLDRLERQRQLSQRRQSLRCRPGAAPRSLAAEHFPAHEWRHGGASI